MKCPECKKGNIVRDGDELVCDRCGLVSGFASELETSKPKTSSLGSVIDGAGPEDWKDVPSEQVETIKRIKNLQEQTKKSEFMNQPKYEPYFVRIDNASQTCGSSNVKENAKRCLESVLEKNLAPGHSLDAVTAAAFYVGCRQEKYPVSQAEVQQYFSVKAKDFNSAYSHIKRALKLVIEPLSAADFIPKYCNLLNVNKEVQANAREIISVVENEPEMSGRSPNAIAAAAIYHAAHSDRGQWVKQDDIWLKIGIRGCTIKIINEQISNVFFRKNINDRFVY